MVADIFSNQGPPNYFSAATGLLLRASFCYYFHRRCPLARSVNSAFSLDNFPYQYVLLINFQSCNVSEIHICLVRSSHQRCSLLKGVLWNFSKFTGKHLRQSLFFNKVAGLRPATLLKKRPCRRCFPVSFVEFPRTPFLQNTSGRLLLDLQIF